MPDVSSGNRDRVVSVEIEAQTLLQELAGPAAFAGGNVKGAIQRAAVRAGLTFGRARRIWYREARIWAGEMDDLRLRAARARAAAREGRINEFRKDDAEIQQRLDRLEIELAALRRGMAGAPDDGSGEGSHGSI
jgi:hypothetical protein